MLPSFSFLGESLTSPLIGSSGTVGYISDFSQLTSLDHFGGLVLKTLTPEPLVGNPHPRVIETEFGMINSIGLQNLGIDKFIENEYPKLVKLKESQKVSQKTTKRKTNLVFIMSLAAFTIRDFNLLLEKANALSHISFFEINVSCPNIDYHDKEFASDPYLLQELVKSLKAVSKKPFIVKLSPDVSPLSKMAVVAQEAGAAALTIGNTFKGIKLDIKNRRPFLHKVSGGYSGPAIRPLMLAKVYEVAKSVKIPIIGCGGVMSGDDVVEYLLAGASLVGMGTANLINPKLGKKVFRQFTKYLVRHKLTHKDLIGSIISSNS